MPKNQSSTQRHRRNDKQRRGRKRRFSIRSERRAQPDVHKIARAVVALAMAQAEADAAAEAKRSEPSAANDAETQGSPDG